VVSAIQTVPSAYVVSQPVRLAAISLLANPAKSPLVLPSTIVSLGATPVSPVAYNASGVLDTRSSSRSATVNQPTSAPVSILTADAATNTANFLRAADLEASTITKNLAVLDTALAESVAKQRLINSRAIAAGLAARDAAVSTTSTSLAGTEQAANTSLNPVATNSAVAQPLVTSTRQSIAEGPGTVASTTPATPPTVIVASNITTNSASSTPEVANALVGTSTFDAAVQVSPSVAQSPTYANPVVENGTSVAAPPALPPATPATPITPEETTAAFAISSINDLPQPIAATRKDTFVNTASPATLHVVTPSLQTVTLESSPATTPLPAPTTNAVAASNALSNSVNSTAEISISQPDNPLIDATAQAVSTVAQNPAYANLVAANYVNTAVSSAQSPSVATTPIRFEEIEPVIAIPALAMLSRLGAQTGRDGSPRSRQAKVF
jgi:hypothetical protein